ncbi:membrane protein insertion efficiency factor YidD [Pseudonocardia sp. MH-G8]|uniref:membrane protein insertion efficiency factor YidD n=1 Tax=Pseudonocardia sp. MH-G8 TaxID=1854588 RepID=UPI0013045262|nr:membrane protein insertion efficiency factor YidD [Pseudonocardia sp. MH-G8]
MTVPGDEEASERASPADRLGGAAEVGDVAGDAASGCGGCDGCDGIGGCNLLRVSSVLFLAAFLVPDAAGRRPVVGLLRAYRRWFTRFTPRCPSTPSCSAYALAAVMSLGPRRGLATAARRVGECGPPCQRRPSLREVPDVAATAPTRCSDRSPGRDHSEKYASAAAPAARC